MSERTDPAEGYADRLEKWQSVTVVELSSDVAVTFYVAEDGTPVVWIDTDHEPDGSDGGPGLRVWVNDGRVV
jgi:hypothetical protein